MGWTSCELDDPAAHEGYAAAVVREDGYWRELRYGDETQPVAWVQVACTCGWRSGRLVAPFGTDWAPASVFFPAGDWDDLVCDVWAGHVEEVRRLGEGAWSLRDLAGAAPG